MSRLVYLSDAWLEAADEAVGSMEPLPSPLTVGYAVDRADGQRTYTVGFGPERVSIRSGLADDATVVVGAGWDTAVAIATGRLSAQRAFLAGELTIAGDPNSLLGHGRALTELDDRLATLRDRTDF